MALTVTSKPSGFQPVNSGSLFYSMTEASLAGKVNYRVEVEFNGLFNGLKFEFRPDATLVVNMDIAPILRSALNSQTADVVSSRFKQTFVKYQAKWDASSDAQVSLSMDVIYFYLASNNILNSRTKLHIDNSLPTNNKFLIPSTKLVTNEARTNYVDWLQRVTDALTFTVTGQVVATDKGTLTKTSGVGAWDSQGYSTQSYVNSCYVSWKIGSAKALTDLFIGLNSDPTLNASYASIDYSMEAFTDGLIYLFENGVAVGTGGTWDSNTVFSIVYDGTNVIYYVNGIQVRSVARAVGAALFLDSSFNIVGSQATQIEFGPSVKWLTSGANITKDSQRQFRKTGGVNGWNEQIYSTESYSTNVYCKAGRSNRFISSPVAFGLNNDPTTDANFSSIDYCWVLSDTAGILTAYIYENGVLILSYPTETYSSIFSIVYDGVNVIYYQDNIQKRSVARGVGAALYFDSSLFTVETTSLGSGLTNVEFGPIPIVNYLNYNRLAADVVLNTQVFTGEKNTLQSIGYSGYTADGTLTVKQVGTNDVWATILNTFKQELCNAVHLKWLNDLGGLSTWVFDFNQVFSITPSNKVRTKTLTLYALNLLPDQWLMLQELNRDSVEYNDIYKINFYAVDFTTESNPLPIVVLESKDSYETNNITVSSKFLIRYASILYNL